MKVALSLILTMLPNWSVHMAYMRFGPHTSVERLEKLILDEFLPMMKLRIHPENQVELSDGESG